MSNRSVRHMKDRIYSWLVAGEFVFWGVNVFYIMPKVVAIFEGMNVPLPFPLRLVFFVGAWGWLALALVGALLAIRFNSIRSSVLLMVALFLMGVGVFCTTMF